MRGVRADDVTKAYLPAGRADVRWTASRRIADEKRRQVVGGEPPQRVNTVRGAWRDVDGRSQQPGLTLRAVLRRGPAPPTTEAVLDDPVAPRPGGASDWCAIVLARSGHDAHFDVIALEKGGRRRVVARSPAFHALGSRRLRGRGSARAAHDRLVKQLVAAGWRRVRSRGRWHDTAFTRPRADPLTRPARRLLIGREDHFALGVARFHADELDAYGNGTRLAESPRFATLPQGLNTAPSDEATAAHRALLEALRCAGWTTVGTAGSQWYATILEHHPTELDARPG